MPLVASIHRITRVLCFLRIFLAGITFLINYYVDGKLIYIILENDSELATSPHSFHTKIPVTTSVKLWSTSLTKTLLFTSGSTHLNILSNLIVVRLDHLTHGIYLNAPPTITVKCYYYAWVGFCLVEQESGVIAFFTSTFESEIFHVEIKMTENIL